MTTERQEGPPMASIEAMQEWFKMQAYLRNIDVSYRRTWNRPFVLFWTTWRKVYDVMLYRWGLHHVDFRGKPIP